MPVRRIHLRDSTREYSFQAETGTLLAVLAAARDDTETIYELLEHARDRYGALSGVGEPDDILDRNAPFQVDLVQRRIAFPGNLIDFSRRGVIAAEDGTLRTYVLGRGFTLYDTDRRMFIDEKASLRSERNLWREALGSLEEGQVLNGIDLGDASLRDIQLWTAGLDDRPPSVNGRSVYELGGPSGPPPTR